MACRSAVKQPNLLTGSSSLSFGTATQCSSEPTSMPAALRLSTGRQFSSCALFSRTAFLFLTCFVITQPLRMGFGTFRPGPGSFEHLLNGIVSPMGQPKGPGTMLTDGYGNTTAWPVLSVGTHRILSYLPRTVLARGLRSLAEPGGMRRG